MIRKLAINLSVSADMLVFDKDERGPDDELKLQFEALQQFTPEEKEVAKAVVISRSTAVRSVVFQPNWHPNAMTSL